MQTKNIFFFPPSLPSLSFVQILPLFPILIFCLSFLFLHFDFYI